jgi:HK97 family phage major capsid protein
MSSAQDSTIAVDAITKLTQTFNDTLCKSTDSLNKVIQEKDAILQKNIEEKATVEKKYESIVAEMKSAYDQNNTKITELEVKSTSLEDVIQKLSKKGINNSSSESNQSNNVDFISEFAFKSLLVDEEFVNKNTGSWKNGNNAVVLDVKAIESTPFQFNVKEFAKTILPNTELQLKTLNTEDWARGGAFRKLPLFLGVVQELEARSPIRALASKIIIDTEKAELVHVRKKGAIQYLKQGDDAPAAQDYMELQKQEFNLVKYAISAKFTEEMMIFTKETYGSLWMNIVRPYMAEAISIGQEEAFLYGETIEQGVYIEGLIPQDPARTYEATKPYDIQFDSDKRYKIGFTKSGNATDITVDSLIKLRRLLPTERRQGAVFLMNSNTLARIEMLKDNNGQLIFNINNGEGMINGLVPEGRILGVPIIIDETIPDIAANAFPIIYANMAAAYQIIDSAYNGVLMRDPVNLSFNTNLILRGWYNGRVKDGQAVRLLKIAA